MIAHERASLSCSNLGRRISPVARLSPASSFLDAKVYPGSIAAFRQPAPYDHAVTAGALPATGGSVGHLLVGRRGAPACVMVRSPAGSESGGTDFIEFASDGRIARLTDFLDDDAP